MPLDWLESLRDEFPRSAALRDRIAKEFRSSSPLPEAPIPGAGDWFLWLVDANQSIHSDFRPPGPVVHVGPFQHWLAADPEGASHWVVTQQGDTREEFARTLITSIAETDPEAAKAWIRSLSKGARRSLFMDGTLPIDTFYEAFQGDDGFNVTLPLPHEIQ